MWSKACTRRAASKSLKPYAERLDARVMLAASGHTLGPYIAPATITPRVTQPSAEQSVRIAINNYLAAILGETQLKPIQAQVLAQKTGTRVQLTERILQQPFVQTLFGTRDTYTLLNSAAMGELIGVNVISDRLQTDNTVRYLLPDASAILAFGSASATVQIPPNDGVDGFIAEVPLANLRKRSDGLYTVDVPRDRLPANAPTPVTINVVTGALQQTFQETGPILSSALLTGQHTPTPNAPRTVPGLRLARFLGTNAAFPAAAAQRRMLRQLRIAVSREVYTPDSRQIAEIQAALAAFLLEVDDLNQSGVFTPQAPPVAPIPIRGPLNGTLVVSVAAIRDLTDVPVPLRGLPLGEVTDTQAVSRAINLRGRIDVGYLIDKAGNFGMILTARGPLLANPPGFTSSNTIAGDVRIEVSNASTIQQLGGIRVEEGLTVGAALQSTLGMSNSAGIAAWSTSVGYGSGFQYGTSVAFSKVIPLGNINALLPAHPPR
jgi:hypothetical protein